jgi:hypothetical protein
MSYQPPSGNPDQPQQGATPPPSQPYYPPPYPQQPAFPPQQPSAPYPPPFQPVPYAQPGGDVPPAPYPQTGAPYAPPSQPYQPTYPGQPVQPQTGYPPGFAPTLAPIAPPSAKTNNALGLIIGGSALVLILALLGSMFFLGKSGIGPLAALGATPTPVPTATSAPTATPIPTPTVTVPNGFSPFTASDGSYSIAYPSDWITTGQTSNGASLEAFVSPDATKFLLTLPSPTEASPSEYATLLKQFAQGLGGKNVAISTKTSRVKLGANTWNKVTGTMVFQGGSDDLVMLGTDHNAATFFIIYFAPAAQMTATVRDDFTPMVASFQFLK